MNILLTIFVLTETIATDTTEMNYLLKAAIIAVVIGLIIGLIYALSLKGQLTSVYKNDSAADYTRENSFKVDVSRDTFMYSKTEKVEKQETEQQKK